MKPHYVSRPRAENPQTVHTPAINMTLGLVIEPRRCDNFRNMPQFSTEPSAKVNVQKAPEGRLRWQTWPCHMCQILVSFFWGGFFFFFPLV